LGLAVVIPTPTSTCGGPFASQLCVSLMRIFDSRRNYCLVFMCVRFCAYSLRGSLFLVGITIWLFIYSGGALRLLGDLDWEKPRGLAGMVKRLEGILIVFQVVL